jgi:voltage-dependent potassium channel beta subunit
LDSALRKTAAAAVAAADAGVVRTPALSCSNFFLNSKENPMHYRRLGNAGLKVSELSFGSWVTFKTQLDDAQAIRMMEYAYERGVNFFDNAEAYAGGEAERIMGRVLKKLQWRRASYVMSTKFYWGLHEGPNEKNTLNRKYLMQAIDGSLERLQLDHIDLIFCHRPDPHTPMEEVVRAMSDIITQGKALYWGTSEWSADQIMQAWQIAERHHLHKPQMEQPQYNLVIRDKVEQEFARLYAEIGLGLTTWSPLCSGLLTGKYQDGIPTGSRASLQGYEWLAERWTTHDRNVFVPALVSLARSLDCTPGQLAIAWCLKNPNVSTVILGASTLSQLQENLDALKVLPQLSEEIMSSIARSRDT